MCVCACLPYWYGIVPYQTQQLVIFFLSLSLVGLHRLSWNLPVGAYEWLFNTRVRPNHTVPSGHETNYKANDRFLLTWIAHVRNNLLYFDWLIVSERIGQGNTILPLIGPKTRSEKLQRGRH